LLIMNLEIKEFLDSSYERYHNASFIQTDPLQIPHKFKRKEDIEIAAFLTATIAWGQRKTIIRNADRLMKLLDDEPYSFITGSSQKEWTRFQSFVHRTFQPADLYYFLDSLRRIYLDEGGLENVFNLGFQKGGIFESIQHFREVFLQWSPQKRTLKHVSDPGKGSAAKRINLFLMWMCRPDEYNIHFGLWNEIPASALIIPLDVHVGRVARALGLLDRKANDWVSASSLTGNLSEFDPLDPVKYDFSLFGIGLEKKY